MDERFDPRLGLVFVAVRLDGPTDHGWLSLVADTGAERTTIRPKPLRRVGCAFDEAAGYTRMTTASGVERRPLIRGVVLTFAGVERPMNTVVAHEFPDSVLADGVLGLDFFRPDVLTIDFSRSTISLRPPGRRWWPFGR